MSCKPNPPTKDMTKNIYTILFKLVGVKNTYKIKYDSLRPGGEWT